MNSIAGGGTLLTFPALLAAGVSPVVANATSTVALVPGSLSGAWGYRSEIRHLGRWTALLIVPSLAGGAVGSLLVRLRRRGVVHVTGAIVGNRADIATVHLCHRAIAYADGSS